MRLEFWEKAEENLAAAEDAFIKERFNASANRAYYAAFQAAISALANEGFRTNKISHEWVQSTFNRELTYRKKLYSSETRNWLLKMQEIRDKADYEPENVTFKIAKEQLVLSRKFIGLIKEVLEK